MCLYTGGYTCFDCGLWVEYGTTHYCSRHLSIPLSFNYECPDCQGRFNIPAYDYKFNTSGVPKCPFCGREMIGLNQ